MSESDRGQVLVGRLLAACQLTGILSLLGGGVAFIEGMSSGGDANALIASGILFAAAAIAFGLAANAVLRQ